MNKPTRLLCAVVWLKLSKTILNKGTQKEAAAKFQVWEKQLSQLITGRKYWGSTTMKDTPKKRKATTETATKGHDSDDDQSQDTN